MNRWKSWQPELIKLQVDNVVTKDFFSIVRTVFNSKEHSEGKWKIIDSHSILYSAHHRSWMEISDIGGRMNGGQQNGRSKHITDTVGHLPLFDRIMKRSIFIQFSRCVLGANSSVSIILAASSKHFHPKATRWDDCSNSSPLFPIFIFSPLQIGSFNTTRTGKW